MEEKIKEVETELDRVRNALRDAESENVQLKDELKETEKGEEKLNEQLKTLQGDLEIILSKQKEAESVKEEKMNKQIQEYKEQVSELESKLSQSLSLQSEVEAENESLTGRCAEQERRAKATHEFSLELKGLIQSSHSKVEGSNKRVSEFERTLKMEKSRVNEFEEEIERLEEKCGNAETEKRKYADLVSELSSELEKSRLTISRLQKSLEGHKVAEMAEKLSSTEDKLEEEIAKTTNLESARANLLRSSETKLKEVVDGFTNKDSEMKSLYEKLELLKDQLEAYKGQATDSIGKSVTLKGDLDRAFEKVGHLEASNEELKKMRQQAEEKAAKSVHENQLLVETNLNLSDKVFDLQHQLEDATVVVVEKDDVVEQLNSSNRLIQDLTTQLASETQRFQNELSSITDQKQHLVDRNVTSQNELQNLLTKLEEQVKEYRGMNESLKDELEKLTLEEAHNFASRARAKELEDKLKEVESVRAFAQKAEDEDTSIEKKEGNLKPSSDQGSGNKQAFEDLEYKCQQVVELEMLVKELRQKLQADGTGESMDDVSIRGHDIGSVNSSPRKRKNKNSGSPSSTSASSLTHAKTVEASASHANLKLVFGVALASIIIGLVLGRSY